MPTFWPFARRPKRFRKHSMRLSIGWSTADRLDLKDACTDVPFDDPNRAIQAGLLIN
ncbi:hypothetical protein DESC_290116 [Desulfosarcina cetonica]|nr:hypothetical protein DESC_290116 [Desulfosarcina cetonica]